MIQAADRLFLIDKELDRLHAKFQEGVVKVNVKFDGMADDEWTSQPVEVYKEWKVARNMYRALHFDRPSLEDVTDEGELGSSDHGV